MAKLLERNLMQAEYARQSFRAVPPSGTKIEDMLDPQYWAHVSSRFNPHDIIEVVPEDGAYFARLFVVNTGHLTMKVDVLEYKEFGTTAKAEEAKVIEGFEVKWGGANGKWRVHRKTDNAVVSASPYEAREDAEQWLQDNIKTLAA